MPEYDLTYLKRKKRKKAVLASMTIACTLAIIIALVALLAKHPGAFTVSLNKGSASVALSTHEDFTYTQGTGYLSTPKIPGDGFKQTAYMDLLNDDVFIFADSEATFTPQPIGEEKSIPYYKYTFFIRNFGNVDVDYDLKLTMATVGTNTTNKLGLDATVRVGFMENRDLSKHDINFYAMRSTQNYTINENGSIEYLPEDLSTSNLGIQAIPFESNNIVLRSKVENFFPDEVIRYTFIFWVEGEDPDCVDEPPDNTLRFEVVIEARESSNAANPDENN